jgi:YesN/AraC family two-component response regulator
MENTTLRLPSSLKSTIAEAAKEHGRTFSEEIRFALQMHYKTTVATASVQDINDAILEHVTSMHLSPQQHYHEIVPELEAFKATVANPRAKKSRERSEEISAKEADEETRLILENLLDHLRNGEAVTAKQLEKETHIPSREVSKLLKSGGIVPRNTRMHGVAGRYFLPEVLPNAEKAYRDISGVKSS